MLYATGLAQRLAGTAAVVFVGPSHLPLAEQPRDCRYVPVRTGSSHRETMLRTLSLPALLPAIVREVRAFQPDLVHFPLSHPWNPAVAAALRQYPIVFTVHDPLPHSGAKWQRVTWLTHSAMYRLATRFVVLSRFCHRALPPSVRDRATVVPLPALTHYCSSSPVASGRHRIVYFGRVEPYKGVNTFCDAAALLVAEGSDADFVIAGSGPLPENVNRIPESHRTIMNRYISEQEVSDLLASASLVVLPYTDATQSAVLAAAYAAGVPVVATTVGSLPEFVEHERSGLLVAPGDPVALAKAVARVVQDPALHQRLRLGAVAMARTELSWERAVEGHLEAYAQTLAARREGAAPAAHLAGAITAARF